MGSVLGSVDFTFSWCASSNAWCKTQAVTWWAGLDRVMCAAQRQNGLHLVLTYMVIVFSEIYAPENLYKESAMIALRLLVSEIW